MFRNRNMRSTKLSIYSYLQLCCRLTKCPDPDCSYEASSPEALNRHMQETQYV